MMLDFHLDEDGIATISWNVVDRPMNVLNTETIAAFTALVQKAVADEKVVGVVIASSRPEFIAGADLALVRDVKTIADSMGITSGISKVLRDIERSGKPFVAAINGAALGGGFEVCLACHRRIAADAPAVLVGLPEVTLGLLPAAGGTQRLPRMIGIKNAMPFLLEGKKVGARDALKAGLVDEVVPAADLLARAKSWLLTEGAKNVVRPWDAKGFAFPGGKPQAPALQAIFMGANAAVLAKTQGLYPAPEAILACLYDGCQGDFDAGLKIEQRFFATLATSATTQNMIRSLFYSIGEANRLGARPKNVPISDYKKLAVLGAGMMGAGIAYVAALSGLEVVLLDATIEGAEKGKSYSAKTLEGSVKKGRLDPAKAEKTLSLIKTTTDYNDLADCDFVIEAVFEDRYVKADVIKKVDAVIPKTTIFASNTSTLPVSSLAENFSRPDQFIGLHFFSPVEKMPLLEVIKGKKTSAETLAKGLDMVKRLKKTPIVVEDCRSFYCNRAFALFTYEALIMLKEGVAPALIENASRQTGLPVPPLALIDEVTVELLYKATKAAKEDLGDAYKPQPQDEVLDKFVVELGRIGKKAGKGFYDYENGSKKLWPGLAEHYPLAKEQPSVEEIKKRILYVQSVEAARCVEEGVVSAKDADIGSILGWGFPAAFGGAISLIDTVGASAFVAECDILAAAYGERFTPPKQLRELAAKGGRYIQ